MFQTLFLFTFLSLWLLPKRETFVFVLLVLSNKTMLKSNLKNLGFSLCS